jgi:hypothetical protein
MRSTMTVQPDDECEAGFTPKPEPLGAIEKSSAHMVKADVPLEGGGGLLPSSKAARVRASGGNCIVTDGPFAETKELASG